MSTRTLYVFSDPGGAKPCLALAAISGNTHVSLACSDRKYGFYDSFSIPVTQCSATDAESIIAAFQPARVYAGTSYTSPIALEFIATAKRQQVKTIAFVDHYTRFRDRFLDGERLILPDEVQVLDEHAAELARDEEIPGEIIKVVGNPYHRYLQTWKSQFTRQEVWTRLGFDGPDRRTFLFAPDPLSNVGGADKYGLDEAQVLKMVLSAAQQLANPCRVIVKPHPNQQLERLITTLDDFSSNGHLTLRLLAPSEECLLNDVIQHADIVIGMFSSLLIEAEIMGTPTVRVLKGLRIPDPLLDVSTGLTVHNDGVLIEALSMPQ